MTKAYEPKRLQSFRDKYLALALVAAALLIGQLASAQFPNTDSLRRYNNRFIGNSAVQAFSQLRLNTLLHGIINHIDSAALGEGATPGIDTIYAVNDSTIRYIDNGETRNVTVKGGSKGVDSLYKTNDSTLAFILNGQEYTVLVGGYSSEGATEAYVDSVFASIPNAFIPIGYGLLRNTSAAFEPYEVDTLEERNGLVPYSRFRLSIDSLGDLIGIGADSLVDIDDGWGMLELPGASIAADSSQVTSVWQHFKSIDSLAATLSQIAVPEFFAGSGIQITGNDTDGYTWTCTGCGVGSNPRAALSILDYGGARDAVIPFSGSIPTSGTDNTPAFNAMIAAAQDGQVCYIPHGNYWFKTVPDSIKGPKKINLIIDGNTYHINTSGQGIDFLIITNNSGRYDKHNITHNGDAYAKINQGAHSKSSSGVRVSPDWSAFTGSFIKFYNTYGNNVWLNNAEGFWAVFDLISQLDRGNQENKFWAQKTYKNAHAIVMRSLDGTGYNDKNWFWCSRLSGGLALLVDGYSGTAPNGEVYNAASRSNFFHLMVEQVDSIAVVNGDNTDNEYKITVEGGTTTGVYGNTGFKMRSVSPNYVRDPRYTGGGVYSINWVQEGMGIDAQGYVPIWNSANGRRYANKWETDGSGNLILIGSRMSKFQRDDSWSGFNYAPGPVLEKEVSVTASTYTAAAGEYIRYNHASGTLTLPSAGANLQKWVYVKNIHATNSLTIANADITTLAAGQTAALRSDGTQFRNWINPSGTGGGGVGDPHPWVAGGAGYYTADEIAFGGGTPVTTAWVRDGASTTSKASRIMPSGLHPTSPPDGGEWRVGSRVFEAYNGIVFEKMIVPDGGTAGQFIRRNAANDGYEHITLNVTWDQNTPTITAGASGVVGTGYTLTVQTGATNSSGKVTLTTGTGTLAPGKVLDITFGLTGTSAGSNQVAGVVSAGNTNAAPTSIYVATNSTVLSIYSYAALSPSTTYVWYYSAEKK